jgi:hypothetical protein
MSNYGWVPRIDDADDYLTRLALLVSRRPNMEMIEIVNTLQGFVEEATVRAAPPPPIDDELVVGGHANRRGDWMVDPFPQSPIGPWTDFAALEISQSDPDNSIAIPDELVGFSAAAPDATARAFHVKGCNLGRATPWLIKLREALGGHVRVSAPKHYHGVSTNGTDGVTAIEILEWMAYEFVVFRKTPFANRNALAAAFHAKGFTRPDGTPIPRADFLAWLRLLGVGRLDQTTNTERKRFRLPLGRNIGGHRFARGLVAFYCRTPRNSVVVQTFTIPPPEEIPSTHAERVARLPTWFLSDPAFRATHPFPIYQRHGYATLTDMIDGLEWRFTVDDAVSPPTIECIGGRFEYQLLIPIANPGPGGKVAPTKAPLIYNHIPETGAPVVPPAFDETDAFFYGTVP